MIPILLLSASEALALAFRKTHREAAAGLAFYFGLLLMCALVAMDVPQQLVPGQYQEQRIRGARFLLHLCLLGAEFAVLICTVLSARPPISLARRWFWAAWGINLLVIAVMTYAEWFMDAVGVE